MKTKDQRHEKIRSIGTSHIPWHEPYYMLLCGFTIAIQGEHGIWGVDVNVWANIHINSSSWEFDWALQGDGNYGEPARHHTVSTWLRNTDQHKGCTPGCNSFCRWRIFPMHILQWTPFFRGNNLNYVHLDAPLFWKKMGRISYHDEVVVVIMFFYISLTMKAAIIASPRKKISKLWLSSIPRRWQGKLL